MQKELLSTGQQLYFFEAVLIHMKIDSNKPRKMFYVEESQAFSFHDFS